MNSSRQAIGRCASGSWQENGAPRPFRSGLCGIRSSAQAVRSKLAAGRRTRLSILPRAPPPSPTSQQQYLRLHSFGRLHAALRQPPASPCAKYGHALKENNRLWTGYCLKTKRPSFNGHKLLQRNIVLRLVILRNVCLPHYLTVAVVRCDWFTLLDTNLFTNRTPVIDLFKSSYGHKLHQLL